MMETRCDQLNTTRDYYKKLKEEEFTMENLENQTTETTENTEVKTELSIKDINNESTTANVKTLEKIEITQEEFMKKIQSETDKVRTEYSKQIKELKEQIQKSIPAEKSPAEIELENRIKTLEDKEKEVAKKELELKVSKTLSDNGLPSQLSKYINLQGVEDVESYLGEVKDIITKHTNNSNLDNSYKPNKHTTTKDVITKEQFTKMSYMERMNLFKSNEELYNKLSK